ncbi:hypothetical protein HanRHA438_Chr09g0407061 [Helianthus annuus]|nr:hypothetical protein HanHA300_Chr09g0324341 [Helianthus annuus]KAJ0542931.1 hypothetical protein HanHA89_Chr09g0345251 [Helianthus annuus]KAJ0707986.1 hypothetical protein HanLR1_Chr09g0324581 [Helianthus annuus]KAJ0711957.1 hypothetical protein HanOQP8_Chr09g0329641 [Helianthus annuus]KAJ0888894.1 hypothetical protein HanRHA438_Chr09g0407061 [Helianthus annuus]
MNKMFELGYKTFNDICKTFSSSYLTLTLLCLWTSELVICGPLSINLLGGPI